MERWDIYDERAEKTGKIVNKGEALLPHEFHLAAEVWILNGKGQVLVQQRSCNCEILPGVWGLTTGRMRMAEDTRTGCARELKEELGLCVQPEELRFVRRILRRDDTHLIWDIYLLQREIAPEALKLQKEEVAQAAWAETSQLREMILQGKMFFYPEIWEMLDYMDAQAYLAEHIREPEEKLRQMNRALQAEKGQGKVPQAEYEPEEYEVFWEEGSCLVARRAAEQAAEVAAVCLCPKARQKGMGKRLIWRCAEWCWQNGISYLWVFVQERQPQRLELYREMGFAPIGRFLQKNAEGASGLLLVRHFFGDEILRRK